MRESELTVAGADLEYYFMVELYECGKWLINPTGECPQIMCKLRIETILYTLQNYTQKRAARE